MHVCIGTKLCEYIYMYNACICICIYIHIQYVIVHINIYIYIYTQHRIPAMAKSSYMAGLSVLRRFLPRIVACLPPGVALPCYDISHLDRIDKMANLFLKGAFVRESRPRSTRVVLHLLVLYCSAHTQVGDLLLAPSRSGWNGSSL